VLDAETCYRALESRDRRFDGRFVTAVRTTGVYCRPGCPAPLPKRQNVSFLACAAAAEEAGYRPCARCRPETSPGTPVWSGTSAVVSRALRLLQESDGDGGVEALAARVGVGPRHLRRLFAEHVGASPKAIEKTRRVHVARKLLDETSFPISRIAFEAGFASIRAFNDAFRGTFRKAPSEIRRGTERSPSAPLSLRLPFRPPLDWDALLGFLGSRAIPGVEQVDGRVYRRTIEGDGFFQVRPATDSPALILELHVPPETPLVALIERVNGLFDLAADPREIGAQLGRDPALAPLVAARPGLRVPGAWSPFELSVRAILGQQVSVKAATTLAGRLAERFGTPIETPCAGLSRVFPAPQTLAGADLVSIGVTRARADAIRGVAAAFAAGRFPTASAVDLDETVRSLAALPGVGLWTAHYIAMRAFREPDALPHGDLVLCRRASTDGAPLRPVDLERRAEAWRPFRAYAALHLWTGGNDAPGSRPN